MIVGMRDVMQSNDSAGSDPLSIRVEVGFHSFVAVIAVDEQQVDRSTRQQLPNFFMSAGSMGIPIQRDDLRAASFAERSIDRSHDRPDTAGFPRFVDRNHQSARFDQSRKK